MKKTEKKEMALSKKQEVLTKLMWSMNETRNELKNTKKQFQLLEKKLEKTEEEYNNLLGKTVMEVFVKKGLKWCGHGDHVVTEDLSYIYYHRDGKCGSEPFDIEITRRFLVSVCPSCKGKVEGEVYPLEKRKNDFFFVDGGRKLSLEGIHDYTDIPGIYNEKNFKKIQKAVGINFKVIE